MCYIREKATILHLLLCLSVEPILLNESYSGNETVENSTAIFICIADGFPLPNIVWLHNETFILTSSRRIISTTMVEASFRPHISEALNSTLTVTGVRLRDAGEYFCRVDPSNIDRGTPFFSSIFELNVVPGGSKIADDLRNLVYFIPLPPQNLLITALPHPVEIEEYAPIKPLATSARVTWVGEELTAL